MIQVSLFDQIEVIMNMIVSTPLYLLLLFFLSAIVALMIIDYKKREKIIERIILLALFILGLIILLIFHTTIFKLLDAFMDNIIKTIYFPNYVIYILILATSNLCLIYSLLNDIMNKSYKLLNYINAIFTDFIAILLFNVIVKNNINLYAEITINSNKDLLILLQLTTEIFTLWCILLLMIFIIKYLIKFKDNEFKKQQLQKIKNLKLIKPKNYIIEKNESLIRKEVIEFNEEKKDN